MSGRVVKVVMTSSIVTINTLLNIHCILCILLYFIVYLLYLCSYYVKLYCIIPDSWLLIQSSNIDGSVTSAFTCNIWALTCTTSKLLASCLSRN